MSRHITSKHNLQFSRSSLWKPTLTLSILLISTLTLTGHRLVPSIVTGHVNSSFPHLSSDTNQPIITTTTTSATPGVSIWYPPTSCYGVWRNQVARDSPGRFPYAIVRDAVVDRRPASNRILSNHDPPGTVRIVLYITTHLSTRLVQHGNTAHIHASGLAAQVEYVTHVDPFVIPKVSGGYRPGLKTHYGQQVTEFQVGLKISPLATNGIQQAQIRNAITAQTQLDVNLTTETFDAHRVPFPIKIPIHCVMGWGPLPGNEGRRNACGKDANDASGAILFSGSALYGKKKRERQYYREVANFAARGLLGPVRFDAVAMSVTSNYSYSDIETRCGDDVGCIKEMEQGNVRLLQNVAEVVEEELQLIGVPRELFSRVMIIPLCRLGSDANGTEFGDNCKESKRYGQYHATFFSHAMLAPFYKWAASYDMDEFFAQVPPISTPRPRLGITEYEPERPAVGAAAEFLDRIDEQVKGERGNLMFHWLNFNVGSANDSRALSRDLIGGKLPTLRHRHRPSDSPWCYGRMLVPTGKSAVRCDVGLGFTIHHPIVGVQGKGMSQRQGWRTSRGVRTWHPRFGHLSSSCDYVH